MSFTSSSAKASAGRHAGQARLRAGFCIGSTCAGHRVLYLLPARPGEFLESRLSVPRQYGHGRCWRRTRRASTE